MGGTANHGQRPVRSQQALCGGCCCRKSPLEGAVDLKNLTAHYNSQFCASFYYCFLKTPLHGYKLVLNLVLLGKPSNKKSGLVMEFFRKGFDPLPLIFGSYGTGGAPFNFGHKKGTTKLPQKTQNGYIL